MDLAMIRTGVSSLGLDVMYAPFFMRPHWTLPQSAARDRWSKIFHLGIPPPGRMIPAGEVYYNAAFSGALLVHLGLGT